MALTRATTKTIKDGEIVNADINASAAIAGSKLADDSIVEAKLDISNSASDGQFLQYKDSSDKLTWAAVPAGVGGATGLDLNDDVKIRLGTGNDAYIGFDVTGDTSDTLMIRQSDGEIHIRADKFMLISDDTAGRAIYLDNANDRLELGMDGNSSVYLLTTGVNIHKDVVFDNATNAGKDITWDMSDDALEFADNVKIVQGAGADLNIYSDGTTGIISTADGNITFKKEGTSEVMLDMAADGGVALYYDNSKKLEAVTGGINVSGTVTATAYAGDGSSLTGLQAGATGGNSGGNAVFWENEQTITHDYTISNNKNAGTFGPVTINNGVTVTVGDGETWTVV